MNKEIIKTLISKKITRKNFFINMASSTGRIFLPHFEKKSQLL
jgi:hypothetical protein